MKAFHYFFIMALITLVPACRKTEVEKKDPPAGCIELSQLVTKHDYYLPFALTNDNKEISQAVLNSETVDFPQGGFLEFTENGFYELILKYNDPGRENDTFLFTTITEEREYSEWGTRAWVPAPFESVPLGAGQVEVFYPRRYVASAQLPFVFFVTESGKLKPVYCQGKGPSAVDTFNIKQGVGSVSIMLPAAGNQVSFIVGGRNIITSSALITEPFIELGGIVSSAIEIPANTFVRVTANLEIAPTGSLAINEGAVILIDEAVDIIVNGPVTFTGLPENPVLVTCSESDKYWGGFITRNPGGAMSAEYTFFCRSGYHDSEEYAWGHAGRQALFYTENSTLTLDHCFITDHIGQIFYPLYSTLVLDNILVQRAQTGGQVNYTDLTLRNSVFTDFPDDSYVYRESDNDALYLKASDAIIDNSLFMFAKDDGLDSGDDEGGEIRVTNCRFEACFHEGAALSSAGEVIKNHVFTKCVFINCGQGLELGYSSGNHMVQVENCLFLNNGIGIRYGDNYAWAEIEGKISVRYSVSLYNDRDVWNMVRMNWSPKLENMTFESSMVSKFCPQYPGLRIWNE